MVQSLVAPEGDFDADRLWKEVTPEQLMDSKLKCVFEVPVDNNTVIDLSSSNINQTGMFVMFFFVLVHCNVPFFCVYKKKTNILIVFLLTKTLFSFACAYTNFFVDQQTNSHNTQTYQRKSFASRY